MYTSIATEHTMCEPFSQELLHLVYRYICSYVHRRQDAEDLTTRVFLEALAQGGRSERVRLLQIARSIIADRVQAAESLLPDGYTDEAHSQSSLGTEPPTQAREPAERIEDLLQGLPSFHREVLTFRLLLSLTLSETALVMNMTETSIIILQWHALEKAARLNDSLHA